MEYVKECETWKDSYVIRGFLQICLRIYAGRIENHLEIIYHETHRRQAVRMDEIIAG